MRIGIMAHRHADFDQNRNCIILQQLSLGQVNLDAYIGVIDMNNFEDPPE